MSTAAATANRTARFPKLDRHKEAGGSEEGHPHVHDTV